MNGLEHSIIPEPFTSIGEPASHDRRSGTDRRETTGRRMDDVDLKAVQEDIRDMRDEIKMICQAIQKIAVQEERITALTVSLNATKTDITSIYAWITQLQKDHDQCQIGSVMTEIRWLKWFVMLNTGIIVAAIIGALISGVLNLAAGKHESGNQKTRNAVYYMEDDLKQAPIPWIRINE